MPRNGMLVRISLVLAAAAALATVAVSLAGAARQGATLTGAGSTFVQPLITKWTTGANPLGAATGLAVTYGGGGSGAGVAAIANKTADFGASDAPLSAYAQTCHTCIQIPWALSGTAVIYRLDGVSGILKMTGKVLAKIYLGQIRYWDNGGIKALNKGVSLPHTPITTVHRDSSSGTTYNFTDYLSAVSANFKGAVGVGTFPQWPGSNTAQGHGSSGVAGAVAGTDGAIGYVDVYYGVTAHLKFMLIQNAAGQFVQPKLSSINAAAQLDTTPAIDGSLSIVNPPAKGKYKYAYPISTYTYVDVQKRSKQKAALQKFLKWAVTKGQGYAKQAIFQPLPKTVVTYDLAKIKKIAQG